MVVQKGRQLVALGAVTFALVGLLSLYVWYETPVPTAMAVGNSKWLFEANTDDGWVYTGIPVVANQRLVIKPIAYDGRGYSPQLMLRLGDNIIYLDASSNPISVDVTEWTGGRVLVGTDFREILYVQCSRHPGTYSRRNYSVEFQHLNCTDQRHKETHQDAKEWWNRKSLETTER